MEALKVIEEYGFKYKDDNSGLSLELKQSISDPKVKSWSSTLTLANMHKLYSIILWNELNFDSAFIEVEKAIQLFEESFSMSGLALSYLLKAFIKNEERIENSFISESLESNHNEG